MTTAALALAPLVRAGVIETTGIVVDAASGVSGAGRAPKATSHFCTVDEDFTAYGLLTHRHTPEIEQATGAQVLFTPHLAPHEPRHPGHLLRPADRRRRPHPTRSRCCGDFYADEPFVVVSERSPSTKATLGANTVHLTARFDERTGWIIVISALDNLVKGAAGQAVQCANLALDLPETTGLPVGRGLPVSVTAPPAGFAAPRGVAAAASSRRARPTCPLVATADGRPVAAAAVFTSNLADGRARCRSAGPTSRPPGAGRPPSSSTAATPTPRPARPAAAAAERMCATTAAGARLPARAGAGVLDRPDRHPAADRHGRSPASRALRRRPGRPTAGRRAAEAIMTTDTVAKEVVVAGPGLHRRRHGQGRGDARPEHGDDAGAVLTTDAAAARPSRARGGRAAAPGRRGGPVVQPLSIDGCTSTNDTVIVLASGRGRWRPTAAELTEALLARRAPTWPARWPATPRAPPRSCGSGSTGAASDADAARRRPQGRREPAGQVLVVRPGPLLGPDRERARVGRRSPSTSTGSSVSYGGITVCRRGVAVGRRRAGGPGRGHGRAPTLEVVADLGLGAGEATILTNDLTHAYIDENMRTS